MAGKTTEIGATDDRGRGRRTESAAETAIDGETVLEARRGEVVAVETAGETTTDPEGGPGQEAQRGTTDEDRLPRHLARGAPMRATAADRPLPPKTAVTSGLVEPTNRLLGPKSQPPQRTTVSGTGSSGSSECPQ